MIILGALMPGAMVEIPSENRLDRSNVGIGPVQRLLKWRRGIRVTNRVVMLGISSVFLSLCWIRAFLRMPSSALPKGD